MCDTCADEVKKYKEFNGAISAMPRIVYKNHQEPLERKVSALKADLEKTNQSFRELQNRRLECQSDLQSALKERDEAMAVVEKCLEVFKKEEWKEGSQISNGQIVSAYWFCDYCRARRIDGAHKKDCQNPFLEPLAAIQSLRAKK